MAETSTFRGEIPALPAINTLPGGRTETTVIAGAVVAGGVGTRPVPVNVTASGLLAALVVTVTLADFPPVVVGEKTTFQEQVPKEASVDPQVLVLIENWLESAPVTAMLVIVKVAPPELVSVTDVGLLDVPLS